MRVRTTMGMVVLGAALTASLAGCSADGTGMTGNGTVSSAKATTAPSPTPVGADSPGRSCGPSSGADAAARAIATLPTPTGLSDAAWDAANADYSGYQPCASLSWAVLTFVNASSDSPYEVLLFHHGSYVGTATRHAYPFAPLVQRRSDGVLAVTYRFARGADSNADPTGRADATFTWSDATHRVDMTGTTPPTE
jgi:hypothetical protein